MWEGKGLREGNGELLFACGEVEEDEAELGLGCG